MTFATLSALAEPNRFNIVELLRDYGSLTVSEIANKLGLRLPQSSKHLHVLAEAGLVQVQVDANRRIYSLCPTPLIEMNDWLESFIRIKEEQYDRFEQLLQKAQREDNNPY
ncbi:transcriptional regulator [Cohnella sp. CIP 111063]|uniref:ArsR/SmtB family transcription factor n=1 Tax=unclassified Cohnella TaxID=2636738 RepID=UPI000B8C00B3|nr:MULTISPECIES: metalloregulator ArsR/SmtB family transcription factor [unclassified Cohnella]OXS62330.1 transcriptional regulator [Cohnella sp. CIP 111063]PRX74561.1 DNA-binding transcriptional ArsR family regulator [Cohnella sp. SGD-V74]